MADTSLPKTFHIIYGWAEGRWHARQLVKALCDAGFTESSKQEASVILAHSAGSFFVPQNSSHQICVLVGFPHWPGKSLMQASVQKLWRDFISSNFKYWLLKTSWNIFYLARHPVLTYHKWQALNQLHPFSVIPKTAIMVCNQADAFCPPNLSSLIHNSVINLPGQHDDLWLNPQPYVLVAQNAYGSLRAAATPDS